MSAEGQLIHLFTSNIRELYISDAIDLLAAPPGFVYKFRYERKHVQDQLFSQWHSGDDGIVGTRVIAYHSLQHPANFHRAAYVPLRFGRVIDAAIEGSICTLKFRLEEYAPLPDPDSIEHERLDTIVQDFSEKLRDLLKPYYPDYTGETGRDDRRSATLGPSPADHLDLRGSDGDTFERVVRYMSSALSSPRTLFRIARIVESRHTEKTLSEDGYLELTAGKHYTLEIAHYQPLPSGASDVALVVSTANGVDLLTSEEVPLKSRYDVVPIPFFAPARDSEIQGELTITTRPPNLGAAVRLPTSVKPPTSQVLMNPMVAVVGAVLAVAPATMGDGVAAGLKFAIAGIGAVLATNMLWWRRRRALPT